MLYFFVNQSPFVVDIPKLDGCQATTFSTMAMVQVFGILYSCCDQAQESFLTTKSRHIPHCPGPRRPSHGMRSDIGRTEQGPGRGVNVLRRPEWNVYRKSLLGCYETKQDFLFDDLTSSRSASVSLFAILNSFSKSKILAHIISGSIPLRKC